MAKSGPKLTVTVKDKGWRKMLEQLERSAGVGVKVGVLQGSGTHQGEQSPGPSPSNVELAMLHEFGAPSAGIPERSFLRASIDKHQGETIALTGKLLGGFLDGRLQARQVLGLLGAKVANDVKRYITDGQVQPPDSPETVARKETLTRPGSHGTPRTLVDTGQLVRSLTWAYDDTDKRGDK